MKKSQRFHSFFSINLIILICFSSEALFVAGTSTSVDPYKIVKVGSLEMHSPGNTIDTVDDIAFVISMIDGFSTYDVSNPAYPVKLASYAPTNNINQIVHGAHTFQI